MKKSLSLFLCAFMLFGIFGSVFALAESDSSNNSESDDDSEDSSSIEIESETEVEVEDDGLIKIKTRFEEKGEFRQEMRDNIRDILENEREKRMIELRMRLKSNNGTIEIDKIKVKIEGLDQEQKEIIVGRINAKTGLNLTVEDLENGTRGEILRAYLSNGAKADVRILPDRAAAIAVERLKAKCEERNCTVELREVGRGNNTRAAYVVETEKEARAFFIFKRKMIVSAEVDSETGEILSVRKPWWAFLANEKSETEVEAEVEVESDVVVDNSSGAAGTVEAGSEVIVENESELAAI